MGRSTGRPISVRYACRDTGRTKLTGRSIVSDAMQSCSPGDPLGVRHGARGGPCIRLQHTLGFRLHCGGTRGGQTGPCVRITRESGFGAWFSGRNLRFERPRLGTPPGWDPCRARNRTTSSSPPPSFMEVMLSLDRGSLCTLRGRSRLGGCAEWRAFFAALQEDPGQVVQNARGASWKKPQLAGPRQWRAGLRAGRKLGRGGEGRHRQGEGQGARPRASSCPPPTCSRPPAIPSRR